MAEDAVPMLRTDSTRIAEVLTPLGVTVEPWRSLGGGDTVRCSKGGVAVFLSTSQPDHWASATDERKDLVVVAALGESVLSFWKKPAENRLRNAIISALRQYQWKPPQARS
jgi:hypothetical protein